MSELTQNDPPAVRPRLEQKSVVPSTGLNSCRRLHTLLDLLYLHLHQRGELAVSVERPQYVSRFLRMAIGVQPGFSSS